MSLERCLKDSFAEGFSTDSESDDDYYNKFSPHGSTFECTKRHHILFKNGKRTRDMKILDLSRKRVGQAISLLNAFNCELAKEYYYWNYNIVELDLSRLDQRDETDEEDLRSLAFSKDNRLCETVRKVNLMGNELSTFPVMLFCMAPKLENINLVRNNIGGSFPASFPNCSPKLKVLNLAGNLIDSFPENSAIFWNRLEYLLLGSSLQGNMITEWPKTLWSWQNLKELDLSNNRISVISDIFVHMPRLEHLFLSRNQLRVFEPNFRSDSCPRLKQLKLDGNRLYQIDSSLCHLKQLDLLDLSDNQISHFPSSLGKVLSKSIILLNGNPCVIGQDSFQHDSQPVSSCGRKVPSLFELASRIVLRQIKQGTNPVPIDHLPITIRKRLEEHSFYQVCDGCECPLLCEWMEAFRIGGDCQGHPNLCVKVKTCSKKCGEKAYRKNRFKPSPSPSFSCPFMSNPLPQSSKIKNLVPIYECPVDIEERPPPCYPDQTWKFLKFNNVKP